MVVPSTSSAASSARRPIQRSRENGDEYDDDTDVDDDVEACDTDDEPDDSATENSVATAVRMMQIVNKSKEKDARKYVQPTAGVVPPGGKRKDTSVSVSCKAAKTCSADVLDCDDLFNSSLDDGIGRASLLSSIRPRQERTAEDVSKESVSVVFDDDRQDIDHMLARKKDCAEVVHNILSRNVLERRRKGYSMPRRTDDFHNELGLFGFNFQNSKSSKVTTEITVTNNSDKESVSNPTNCKVVALNTSSRSVNMASSCSKNYDDIRGSFYQNPGKETSADSIANYSIATEVDSQEVVKSGVREKFGNGSDKKIESEGNLSSVTAGGSQSLAAGGSQSLAAGGSQSLAAAGSQSIIPASKGASLDPTDGEVVLPLSDEEDLSTDYVPGSIYDLVFM